MEGKVVMYSVVKKVGINFMDDKEKAKKSRIKEGIFIAVIGAVIAGIILMIITPIFQTVSKKLDALMQLPSNVAEIEERLGKIEGMLGMGDNEPSSSQSTSNAKSLVIRTTGSYSYSLATAYLNNEDSLENNTLSNVDLGAVIARDDALDKDYTVEELVEKKLLLLSSISSEEGEVESYFYGQFNSNGQWDGNCIINTYLDSKLKQITDAEYSNGVLLNCKQIFFYTMDSKRYGSSGLDVWAYSDRTKEDGYSSGKTWLYVKVNDYPQKFTADSITPEDIITADQFREGIESPLYACYSGNISGGFFNDKTGDAYMVFFFVDQDFDGKNLSEEEKARMLGTIRLLYRGNLEDGDFDDNTGKAWEIAKEVNTAYMCSIVKYENNTKIWYKASSPPPMSKAQIDEYVKTIDPEMNFEWPLKWDEAVFG